MQRLRTSDLLLEDGMNLKERSRGKGGRQEGRKEGWEEKIQTVLKSRKKPPAG